MKPLTTLIIVAMIAVIGASGFVYSGLYDVSASSPHSGFVNWLLSTTSHASIERRSGDVEVPNLDDESLVHAGVNDFSSMCAGCHGAPGQQPEAVGQGLNPSPPNLTESAEHMTPAELFWVTKHGVRMTGMPAWGTTHDDEALWPVVAFMMALPKLDAEGYQALLASAEGVGHHAPDDGDPSSHDRGSDHQDAPAPGNNKEAHDDGHDHSH